MKNQLTDKQNERVRKAAQRLLQKYDGNQSAAARALGMIDHEGKADSSWLSRFVRGICGASLDTATLIARELGEDVGELLQIETEAGPRKWSDLLGWTQALPQARQMAPELSAKTWQRLADFACFPPPPEPVTPRVMVDGARLVDNLFSKSIASGSDQPPPSTRKGGHSRSSGRFKTR